MTTRTAMENLEAVRAFFDNADHAYRRGNLTDTIECLHKAHGMLTEIIEVVEAAPVAPNGMRLRIAKKEGDAVTEWCRENLGERTRGKVIYE